MQLTEITLKEIILLQIEYAYIFYFNKNYMETIRFNYETQDVFYYEGEDVNNHWDSFDTFKKTWEVFKKNHPNTKLYIINEE